MKRNEIVETLIKEGFSEKTLVKFSDKQLGDLAERMLSEQSEQSTGKGSVVMNKGTADLNAVKKFTDAGTNVELREKKGGVGSKVTKGHNGIPEFMDSKKLKEEKPSAGLSKEKKSEVVKKAKKGEDIGKKGKGFEKIVKKAKESGADNPKAVAAAAMWKNVKRENTEVKSWLGTIAENNFHSFTSKNEIMELVKTKLNEVEVGPNVKKSHNGIPEFMSYDAISSVEVDESSPTTKPAPTKPKVDPGTKPRTPYSPKPGEKSKPKALKEKNNANK